MKTYCFDLDGTLCDQQGVDYTRASPFAERIRFVNSLFDGGHRVVIFTARGSKSGRDWSRETEEQLQGWGLRYHELILGKPHADFYIDDKAIHPDHFDW